MNLKFNQFSGMDTSIPVQRYQWLMNSHPQNQNDIDVWLKNAESVLIYCFANDYPYLNDSHAKQLLRKGEKIGFIENYFDKIINNINRIN